jgi:hypothetical protein
MINSELIREKSNLAQVMAMTNGQWNDFGTELIRGVTICVANQYKFGVDYYEKGKKKLRQRVHLIFAGIFLLAVLGFKAINESSMIDVILKIATYTYGPLLGLFTFGILTKRTVNDNMVPIICILAPIISFVVDKYQKDM